MPWTVCPVMHDRLRRVDKMIDGEPMTEVCRGFGVSCKVGHEVLARYRENRAEALSNRSRSHVRHGLSPGFVNRPGAAWDAKRWREMSAR